MFNFKSNVDELIEHLMTINCSLKYNLSFSISSKKFDLKLSKMYLLIKIAVKSDGITKMSIMK